MEFLENISKGKLLGLIGLLVVIIAIPLTVYLSQKQQEIRQRAAGEQTVLFFSQGETCANPVTNLSLTPGQQATLALCLTLGREPINGFDITLSVGTALNLVRIDTLEEAVDSGRFNTLIFKEVRQDGTMRLAKVTTGEAVAGNNLYLARALFTIKPEVSGTGSIEVSSATITSPSSETALTVTKPTLTYVISQPSTPTPTPVPTPSFQAAYQVTISSSNIPTNTGCERSDLNCYLNLSLLVTNQTDKPLYNTITYTVNYQAISNKLRYIGFDGQWTSGKSQTTRVVQPGEKATLIVQVSPPELMGEWTFGLYIDGQTCNTTVNPPDCYYYGASGLRVRISVRGEDRGAITLSYVLIPNQNLANCDLAEGQINGDIYEDVNNNGSYNQSIDRSLPGIKVNLQNATNTVRRSTIATGRGRYCFDALSNETYTLTPEVPVGWTVVQPIEKVLTITIGDPLGAFVYANFGMVQGINNITPTPAPTPTPIPGVTVTPTLAPGEISLSFHITMPGTVTSRSIPPKRIEREATVTIFTERGQPVDLANNTLRLAAFPGEFKGLLNLGSGITPGNYIIFIKEKNSLSKRIGSIINLQSGTTNDLPPTEIIYGDINEDDFLNIFDYNILVGCFGPKIRTCGANGPLTDMDDDGDVDIFDFNLLQSAFLKQKGDLKSFAP